MFRLSKFHKNVNLDSITELTLKKTNKCFIFLPSMYVSICFPFILLTLTFSLFQDGAEFEKAIEDEELEKFLKI